MYLKVVVTKVNYVDYMEYNELYNTTKNTNNNNKIKKTGEINARIPQLHSEWVSKRDEEKH